MTVSKGLSSIFQQKTFVVECTQKSFFLFDSPYFDATETESEPQIFQCCFLPPEFW